MGLYVESNIEETGNHDMENLHHHGLHMGVPEVEILRLPKEDQQVETIHHQNLH